MTASPIWGKLTRKERDALAELVTRFQSVCKYRDGTMAPADKQRIKQAMRILGMDH